MSRLPTEIQTGRMGRLSRLPAFFALAGKRAVVAGGGQAAAWKAELLSAAGAAGNIGGISSADGSIARAWARSRSFRDDEENTRLRRGLTAAAASGAAGARPY